jgi:hypothetical protein
VAVVGASAALTGLLFVAVSINIEQILAIGALADAPQHDDPFRHPAGARHARTRARADPHGVGPGAHRHGGACGLWTALDQPLANRGEREPRSSGLLIRLAPSVTITVFLLWAGVSLIA